MFYWPLHSERRSLTHVHVKVRLEFVQLYPHAPYTPRWRSAKAQSVQQVNVAAMLIFFWQATYSRIAELLNSKYC